MDATYAIDCLTCVDAHVHLYDCFDFVTFLESAFSNFKKEAMRHGRGNSFTAVLLLTETSRDNWFHRLKRYTEGNYGQGGKTISQWNFHPTDEICSLWACKNGRGDLCFIAGRQIITLENLEVLALTTTNSFEDGEPLEMVIQAVIESGAIPVIPWGFGKWIGQRGRILKNLLEENRFSPLFLGDNGGRPVFWPRPYHFKEAQKRGLRVLPGSDPLPLVTESRRPGSFGFTFQADIALERPAQDLKHILSDPKVHLQPYGKLERPIRFFRNQWKLLVEKRLQTSKQPFHT